MIARSRSSSDCRKTGGSSAGREDSRNIAAVGGCEDAELSDCERC
jgi:hypothetical protein